MPDQESIESRLARIDEHLRSIDAHLARQVACRHVTRNGECDFLNTVIANDRHINQWAPFVEKIDEHEKKINQWTGALAMVAFICSLIGGLIGVLMAKMWR